MSDDALGTPTNQLEAADTVAYRRLAKAIHPDSNSSASPTERRARELAMVRLNLAYRRLRGDAGTRPRPTTTVSDPTPSVPASSAVRTCDVCGAAATAAPHLHLERAWMTAALATEDELMLCPECAASLRTTGHARVPAASTSARPSEVARARRLARRYGIAALVTVAAFGTVLMFTALRASSPRDLPVGACVQWSGGYTTVPCGDSHSGRIVATASEPAACAARDSFARRDGQVLCIDTAQ